MLISVIVCTHDRCEILRRTIQSLSVQDYPRKYFELIVVDNCSKDRTRDVVYEFKERIEDLKIQYAFEDKLGLSYARNRGIKESMGDIIAFIDDDAIAEKTWLSSMQKVYDEKKDAMCVGGKVILEWSLPKPSWWKKSMDYHFSAVDYGDRIKRLSYPQYPYGTNISFKRSAFNKIGLFNAKLGRIGKQLLAGEEIEVCLNIEKEGGAIYYNPDMSVYHLVQPVRLSKKFIIEKSYWHGRSSAMVEIRHFGKRKVFKQSLYMLLGIIPSLKNVLKDVNSRSSICCKLGYIHQACLFWKV